MNQLTDQTMILPPDERFILAAHLWESLERTWLEKTEKHWHDIEKGKMKCIPAEEVMQKAREVDYA